jgi:hypothetical protein
MRNPYVGPRAFRAGEKLPARQREERELTDLLIAERVVLLHSPSGAGKTSLIQAGLTPRLRAEQLGTKRFEPTIPLRVKTPAPIDRRVRNRYVYSVALDLLGADRNPSELPSLTLPQVLARAAPQADTRIPVLMFDQFEEILTLNPADRSGQQEFFAELGAVLASGSVWVLLAMREEYMGGLDRYRRYFPEHLQTTYRLDFLDPVAARVAIQAPAADQGVVFADDAVDELLCRLTRVKIQRPDNGLVETEAPYVVPFQLQVVCRQLWNVLNRRKRGGFHSIDVADVQRHGDVGLALRGYYADAVSAVALATGADEGVLREWIETQLITPELYRSQTLIGPQSGEVDPQEILLALTDAYLLRSDTRAGVTWYELSHDQLIRPIVTDNGSWRHDHLEPWQLKAREWRGTHRHDLLLAGSALRSAQRSARAGSPTQWEQDFLDESLRDEQQQSIAERARSAVSVLGVLAALQLLVIVVLLVLLSTKG